MKISSRAFKATMAAASMATLSAALVGTALAATPAVPAIPQAPDASQSVPAVPDASSLPKLDNGLASIDQPNVTGAAYKADSPGDNDDNDNLCHGTNGTTDLPGQNNSVQHPCQSDNNTIHDGDLQIAGHTVDFRMDDPSLPLVNGSDATPSPSTALDGVAPNGTVPSLNNVNQGALSSSPV